MPAASTNSESSAGDIPSRKQLKKAEEQSKADSKKAQDDAEEDGDSDGDDSEGEYVVEKIMRHKFEKNGTLLLQVKWQGYPLDEATWEPEENLEGAPDEVKAYYDQIGGKPTSQKSAKKDDKKRKLSQTAADTPSPAAAANARSRGAKKAKPDAGASAVVASKGSAFVPPAGSWEDEVNSIDTMERGEDGVLYVFLMWKSGHRARYSSSVVNRKCPQRLLAFYEDHLQFNSPPEQSKPVSNDATRLTERAKVPQDHDMDIDSSAAVGDGVAGADAVEGGGDINVKEVASAIA